MLTVGDKAPSGDPELEIALTRGPVVLFFFEKAFGADCTVEALEFNGLLADFQRLQITVLGTSVDSLDSHRRFRKEYGLSVPIISDGFRVLSVSYGALNENTGSNHRGTVLIGRDRVILLAFESVTAKGHAAEALATVKRLRQEGAI